jgi:hypothetical protein
MNVSQLYQYYLQNPTYPYRAEGIETLEPILPLQQTLTTDQGSDNTDTTNTTKNTNPYTGQPIRFRDVASLIFNPVYGIPNIMARSQGYTSPFDWAKKAMGIEESVVDPGIAVPTTWSGQSISSGDTTQIGTTGFSEYTSPGVAASYEGSF